MHGLIDANDVMKDLLDNHTDLVIHGHNHQHGFTSHLRPDGGTMHICEAGSTSVSHHRDDHYGGKFNLYDLAPDPKGGKPTLARGYAHSSTREVYFRDEDLKPLGLRLTLLEEDGDGTVPLSSAAVPTSLAPQSRELRTSFAHDQLFLDPKIEKEYAQFLSTPQATGAVF